MRVAETLDKNNKSEQLAGYLLLKIVLGPVS